MLRAMAASPASFAISNPDTALGSCNRREGDAPPAQPLPAHLHHLSFVADLRLDNHGALCQSLELSRSATDDEVLAHAWGRWNTALVDHLVGGFAFACWDRKARILFLARDHAGERPLHFARSLGPQGSFAFASMPLGLCALPEIGHCVDPAYMAHFLAVATPHDSQTFFHKVERLRPGHCAIVTPAGVQLRQYWHPQNAKPIRYARDADYIEDFRERLDRAVAVRLAASSGLASDLSGGLDSSSVTATAARLLELQGQRLTSFTAVPLPGFGGKTLPGRIGDEGPLAAEVAALYPNIDHVRVDTAGHDIVNSTALASRLSGQPVFNPTNQLWVHAIADSMCSRGLGVLLQGVSGNATISFGGLVGLSDLLKRGRLIAAFRQARELRAGGHTSWRGAASWAMGPFTPLWLRRKLSPEMREFSFHFSPVHPDRAAEYRLKEKVFETIYGSDESSAAVRRLLYEYFDPGVNNGAAAAGWQIEQRDPTQDKHIYEFCYGIPIEQYLAGGQARSLIRRAMQGRLPDATLCRTARGLQAADWYIVMGAQLDRLAAELRRIEQSPMVRHLIDIPRMHTLLETWPSSGYDDPKVYDAWHLALSRGIAAGSFIAQHDPQMSWDQDAPLQTERPGPKERPGDVPGLSSTTNA